MVLALVNQRDGSILWTVSKNRQKTRIHEEKSGEIWAFKIFPLSRPEGRYYCGIRILWYGRDLHEPYRRKWADFRKAEQGSIKIVWAIRISLQISKKYQNIGTLERRLLAILVDKIYVSEDKKIEIQFNNDETIKILDKLSSYTSTTPEIREVV